MAKTLEELAMDLTSNQDFNNLSPEEQDQAFRELAKDIEPPGMAAQSKQEEPSFLGSKTLGRVGYEAGTRPAAANRAALQAMMPGGETPQAAYQRGVANPESIPKFQDLAVDAAYNARKAVGLKGTTPGIVEKAIGMAMGPLGALGAVTNQSPIGTIASGVGMAADVATNPLEVAAMVVPALKPVKVAGEAIAGTKAGKFVGRAAQAVGDFDINPVSRIRTTKQAVSQALEAAKEGVEAAPDVLKKLSGSQRTEYFNRLKGSVSGKVEQDTTQLSENLLSQKRALDAEQASASEKAIRERQALPEWKASEQKRLADEKSGIEKLISESSKKKTNVVREKGQKWLKDRSDKYEQLIEPGLKQAGDEFISAQEMIDEFKHLFPYEEAKQAEAMRVILGPKNTTSEGTTIKAAFDNAKQHAGRYSDQLMSEQRWFANQIRQAVIKRARERGITSFDEAAAFWKETSEVAKPLVRDFRVFDKTDAQIEKGMKRLQAAAKKDKDEYISILEDTLGESLTDEMKVLIKQKSEKELQQGALGLQRKLKEQAIANEKRSVENRIKNSRQLAEDVTASRKSLAEQKLGEDMERLAEQKFNLDERDRKHELIWKWLRHGALASGAAYGAGRIIKKIGGRGGY